MGRVYRLVMVLVLVGVCQGCGVYSFGGVTIPASMKTISVQFFENNAPLVVPTLSNDFTETLKQKIRNETRLSIVRSEGDASIEGKITDYTISSTAIQGDNVAGLLRLTITVSVKYTNALEPKDSFEQSFSRSTDFKGTIQSKQQEVIRLVNKMLTEDIFNRAFANW